MSKLNLIIVTILMFLFGCKAAVETGDGEVKEVDKQGFVGHCSKYILVQKYRDRLANAADTSENATKTDAEKEKRSDETPFFVSYTIEKDAQDNRYIKCSLSDGKREYKGDAQLSGSNAYLSKNYCDIVYDLDDKSSFGTFTFEYSQDWAWIHYEDEEADYNFDIKFRNSECMQFN